MTDNSCCTGSMEQRGTVPYADSRLRTRTRQAVSCITASYIPPITEPDAN